MYDDDIMMKLLLPRTNKERPLLQHGYVIYISTVHTNAVNTKVTLSRLFRYIFMQLNQTTIKSPKKYCVINDMHYRDGYRLFLIRKTNLKLEIETKISAYFKLP